MKKRISWISVMVLVVALLPLASVGATGPHPNITPFEVEEVVFPGGELVVEKTVHTPVIPPMLDFFLVVDLSGSYSEDLINIKNVALPLCNAIQAEVPDAQFGLATFVDYPYNDWGYDDPWYDYAYRLDQDLTADCNVWDTAVQAMGTRNGGDGPESQYEALYQLATGAGRDVGTAGASLGDITAGFGGTFRSDSTRVAAITTDASFHTTGDSNCVSPAPCPFPYPGPDEATTVGALNADGISVVAIKAPGSTTQMDDLASLTGGSVVATDSSSTEIADAILEGLGNLPVQVSMASDCEAPISTSFATLSPIVTSGADAVFTETISVAADAPGGTYECTDWALINDEPLDGVVYTVTQGNTTFDVAPLAGSQTVADFYDYNTVPASANTGLEASGVSLLFLYTGPDGLSLVTIHDEPNDGSGGQVDMTFSNLPLGASWVVQDDPGEDTYAVVDGSSTVNWNWVECCTDGGALSGGLYEHFAGEACVAVDPSFNSGIDNWWFLSGDSEGTTRSPLTLDVPIEICSRPLIETKIIKVPEGFLTGGGQIGKGSRGHNFGGNVGFLADFTTVGQWQFNDKAGLKMHSTSIEYLQFWNDELEGPEPPDANANAAYFAGTARVKIGNAAWDDSCMFFAEAHDHGEPARKGDSDQFGIAIDCGDFTGDVDDLSTWDHYYEVANLDTGNLQIHSGIKDG